MHDLLRERLRAAEGRAEPPTAGVVDAQSVKGAATVGRETRGYDGAGGCRRSPSQKKIEAWP